MSDIIEEVKRTPMQHRQRINFVILGLVLLASGFGLGASTTFFCLQSQGRIRQVRPPDDERKPPVNPVEKWAAQYNFTDEQKDLAKAAWERQHEAFLEFFAVGREKMEAARNVLVQDMNDILTPEQFKPWHEEFKKHLERRRRGWGRPPRGRGDGPRRDEHRNRDKNGVTRPEASPQ